MIQLNLLPDIKKEFLRAQKARNTVVSASIVTIIVTVGLTVLAYLYVTFGQQLQISLADGNIDKKSKELHNIAEIDKYLTLQNQLKALPTLHDSKTNYSRIFEYLPQLNPGAPYSINLLTLQVSNDDKTILFSGTSATFEALNVFKDTLANAQVEYKTNAEAQDVTREKLFDKITVDSAALGRVNNKVLVNFSIKANYKEEIFKSSTSAVKVSVPSIQTTQSVLQSPKPVFNGGGQ
jgi:hypothetical protein